MNPIGVRYKAFDTIAGGSYFRKWLDRSLEAMKRAATSRAPKAEDRAAGD